MTTDDARDQVSEAALGRLVGEEPTSGPACPAALNIKGEHFPCDWPTDADGTHSGWAHSNRDAEAIWTEDPEALRRAWDSAEASGR